MKNRITFLLALTFGTCFLTETAFAVPSHICQSQERVAVELDDLPEKVKNTMNAKSYTGWTITEAFLITNEDNSQYYELVVRKTDEQTRIKVDKDGNVLN
ncbi:hypothetical protein [Dyadobacter bucti]|uniref:hypothetical protein n=1 Tax=Dyadobacter bucti TaxID=2572203 RepID=UPI0011089755|nr:hypothetical protein [Dyadobacter bucti]